MDATRDETEVVVGEALLLPGVAGGDGDGSARVCEERVDPARHAARAVMCAAIRAEANIDRDRLLLAPCDIEQVLDCVNDPRRVAEGGAPLLEWILLARH